MLQIILQAKHLELSAKENILQILLHSDMLGTRT